MAKKKKKGYNTQTGKPTRRDKRAMKRLEELTEKYVAKGMSQKEARDLARTEMRANPRKDWRAG
jgi:hypothetical protein